MGRYIGPKEKLERRIGKRLFLKGERSLSPKSAAVKRMYPPGQHGKNVRRRVSEFGKQLTSKQRVKLTYRMLEKQFKNFVKEAILSPDETPNVLVSRLERRLDNVVYRSGLAQSRDQARQIVNHGHILVNGRKVSIPSYEVKTNDTISVREGSKKSKYFSALVPQWIKQHEAPKWIALNPDSMTASVQGIPTVDDSGLEAGDLQEVVEFYSR